MMKVFLFGNGNLSFQVFTETYATVIDECIDKGASFIVCDFRGTDTLVMEYLKCRCNDVTVYHVGEKPRYFPDKFRTFAGNWKMVGGFCSDVERDTAAMENCTHFYAMDFNTDDKRVSGTRQIIDKLSGSGKVKNV